MAKQGISTGSAPNDGTGDTLLAGAVKINDNFDELYTYLGNGSSLNYIGGRWANTSIGINTLSNVGIGTTNPTSALTVTGDGKVTGDVTGTASTAQGLTGTPTISVADVTASGKVSAGGSVTGATIHGSGNALAGIVTFINPGTNISVSANQGYVTINASGSGGQGYFTQNATGINTSSNVGIGTTTADHTLTVAGVTSTTNLSVTGLSTFSGKIEGAAVNNVIPFYYDNVGQFPSASTYHGAFAHAHNTGRAYFAHAGWKELVNVEANGIVGTGTQPYNVGLVTAANLNVGVAITMNGAAGIITATSFVGDGSGLSGIVGSGSGVVVKDGGSLVGTAGTINFADNLTVSAVSGAAVTVTASTPNNLTAATLVVSGVTTATGGVVGNVTGNVTGNVSGTAGGLTGTPNITVGFVNGAGASVSGVTSTTSLEVNSRYGVTSGFGTFTAQAGVAHTINEFTIASNNFKSAEYTVHIERENTQQVQKVLVMQNGSTAYSSEYGIIYNPSLIASIGANVASGVMKLEVTPETGQTGLTTYRFTRETMK